MSNQKGFSKVVLIIVALILLGGVYFVFSKMDKNIPAQNTENQSSQSNQSIDEDLSINNWKTFTKYGFEFKYPAEWIVKNAETMRYWFTLTDDLLYFEPNRISPKNSLTMTFSLMDNTANKYTIDSLAGCVNSEAQIILECNDVIINGISYKRVIGKNSLSEVGGLPIVLDQKYIKVVTVFNNKSLVVSAKINNERSLDENVILSKFDSILPTFKFIK